MKETGTVGTVTITQETKNRCAAACDECGHGFLKGETARLVRGKNLSLSLVCADSEECEERRG